MQAVKSILLVVSALFSDRGIAGSPPNPDLVHLGLVPDGQTASLVPGEPALNVTDADVAVTRVLKEGGK
jgi:6-phosphogluconolactonase/glucosamine-6-phosphate isomerase/deaminase